MLGHRSLVPEDYLVMLKRRWWIIVLPLIVLPLVAYAFSYLIPPRYMSQTFVLIQGPKVPDTYVQPVVTEDLESRLSSMKDQILSRSNVQPIVERYNLYGNQHLDMDDRIDMARKDIEVQPIASARGGVPGFYVRFKADDAHTAQLVCSDITSLFLNENLRQLQQSAEGTTDFLKGQLDDAKRSLDDQDAKLAAFEREYIGRLPGEEDANTNMLSTLNTQLEAITQQIAQQETNRSYIQAMLTQQGVSSVGTGPSATSAIPNPAREDDQAELQKLLNQETDLETHYTSSYPDVIAIKRKISDLRADMAKAPKTIPATGGPGASAPRESNGLLQLRAELRAADVALDQKRKEQAQIQGSIRSYQARIESSPMIEEQYKQLTRNYQTAQKFYDDLLSKMNESKMATDLEKQQQGEQFSVLDPANLPDAPFSPKRVLFLGSGAVFGFALGLAIAALLEYRDTSMRTDRDVWAFTKLPTLGVIGYSAVAYRETHKEAGRRRFGLPFRRPRQTAGAQG